MNTGENNATPLAELPPTVPDKSQSAIEQVLKDIHCPACQYNLRGLIGNLVRCPECGASCDINKMVTMQWTKPWYRPPITTL